MARIAVNLIDACKLPDGDPRRVGVPACCASFYRPDLPCDVGFNDAVRDGETVTVTLHNDSDAVRDDVKAAIARAAQ